MPVRRLLMLVFLVFIYFGFCLNATTTRTALSSSTNLWKGFPAGTRVSVDGVITPSSPYGKSVPMEATPISSCHIGKELWTGTAPEGNLYCYSGGRVAKKAHFDALMVSALLPASGTLLVGTSTPARLYRLDPGAQVKKSLIASFDSDYIWSLVSRDGYIYVATGKPAAVYRVDGKGNTVKLFAPETKHVRALTEWNGLIYACTSSPASLYQIGPSGIVCVASFDETEASILINGGSRLWIGLNKEATSDSGDDSEKPPSFKGESALYSMKNGTVPVLFHSFSSPVTAAGYFSEIIKVGLGDGRLFEIKDKRLYFSARWKDSPVATIDEMPGIGGVVSTVSPSTLRIYSAENVHTYMSPVIDAETPAVLGRGLVNGEGRLTVRVGNTPEPDKFWSEWITSDKTDSFQPARYFQWKVDISGEESVSLVSISYRMKNRPPVFKDAAVNPPGMIKVQMPGQLGDHLVREINGKQSAFPALAQSSGADSPPQVFYLQGYRMVSWDLEDPDGDKVSTSIELTPEGTSDWIKLAEGVKESYYSFDARGLPDGFYIIRLTASDASDNQEGEAERTVVQLPVFIVDNTPPKIKLSSTRSGELLVEATDASAVQSIRASIDGGEWIVPKREKGRERYSNLSGTIKFKAGKKHWIAVQAVDSSGNMAAKGWLTK